MTSLFLRYIGNLLYWIIVFTMSVNIPKKSLNVKNYENEKKVFESLCFSIARNAQVNSSENALFDQPKIIRALLQIEHTTHVNGVSLGIRLTITLIKCYKASF